MIIINIFIVRYIQTQNKIYETENKISAQEAGEVRNFGQGEPNEILTVNGGYEYDAPDGTRIKLQYKADENGFVPVGDHLPTPPPVPPAIAKAVAYLLSLPSTTEAPAGRR
ncbi:unnamed protein product [Nesidiocoris tenuis]|uniref:Endocuticle structural glycoprotein SgAbd-2 n=1 Tax=Nesidiocoris tenuis TaxID=355587 RepID=A0A6H5H6Q6_9HEMI|nr:unnamed protein product [Nesidiocoris tenuis]CAB0015916.1 unnamed protein product [Nesidiocoris tenuis]